MRSKLLIRPGHHARRNAGHGSHGNFVTALKALLLVAAAWGLVFPALLWSLRGLMN
jgi:hypothetical protein